MNHFLIESMDGVVNRHNCVICAYENPHKVITKALHSPKDCVWMGFSAKHKLSPFFFDNTVDQHNYTAMLENYLLPQLKQKRICSSTIFQHDETPPHFSVLARECLEKNANSLSNVLLDVSN